MYLFHLYNKPMSWVKIITTTTRYSKPCSKHIMCNISFNPYTKTLDEYKYQPQFFIL